MAGNLTNVGHEGFPEVTVTNGSAAVIPSQFTGAPTGGPMMRFIGAPAYGNVTSSNGNITESFNGFTQAIGYSKLGTAQQMQAIAMARDPGALVLEIVGGKDLGPNASPPTSYVVPSVCNFAKVHKLGAGDRLSVRSGPGARFSQTDTLAEDAVVYTCDERWNWCKIFSGGPDSPCGKSYPEGIDGKEVHACKSGWVNRKWIDVLSG